MSGKNLVLKLWPKMLSANQIAGIFDHLYILKGLIPHFDFLHADRHPWKEEAECNTLGWACPGMPDFACGASGLHPSIHPSIHLSIHPSILIHPSIHTSINPSIYLSLNILHHTFLQCGSRLSYLFF